MSVVKINSNTLAFSSSLSMSSVSEQQSAAEEMESAKYKLKTEFQIETDKLKTVPQSTEDFEDLKETLEKKKLVTQGLTIQDSTNYLVLEETKRIKSLIEKIEKPSTSK